MGEFNTVGELVAALQQCPQDAKPVFISPHIPGAWPMATFSTQINVHEGVGVVSQSLGGPTDRLVVLNDAAFQEKDTLTTKGT